MKFVNMHKGLVRFPAVGTFIITIPSNKELHGGSFMMITTMSDNFVGLRAWDLVEVKRDFLHEMILSYYRPADDDCYTAIYHLCMNGLDSIVLSRHFI